MSAACFFCEQAIEPDDVINLHHPVYRSQGGKAVEPARERCHVVHHSDQGDFSSWGRIGDQISAITRRRAFNNPAFDFDRSYYLAHYAHFMAFAHKSTI
jgi:hypothetical protein